MDVRLLRAPGNGSEVVILLSVGSTNVQAFLDDKMLHVGGQHRILADRLLNAPHARNSADNRQCKHCTLPKNVYKYSYEVQLAPID